MITVSQEQLHKGDSVVNVNTCREYHVTGIRTTESLGTTVWMRRVKDGNETGPYIAFNPCKHTRKI